MSDISPIGLSSGKAKIETGRTDDYELISRIGSGRYGEVFEAMNVTDNKRVAIKVLKPVRPDKVIREIDILKHLSDGQNIITLKDIIINNGFPSLVFPFISRHTLKSLALDLNPYEVHYYLLRLLRAIDFTHRHKIIHRDIKPSNVVIDRSRKLLRLIDWGLADYYTEGKAYSVSVASRHYKSPELLCNYAKYDYSLDIWSFGCIVAALLTKKEPFFSGMDNLDQLDKICFVLGTPCLRDYLKKYNLNKPGIKPLESNFVRQNWKDVITASNPLMADDMSVDFVDKLLVFDHKFRLTTDEALSHPFFEGFNSIRK